MRLRSLAGVLTKAIEERPQLEREMSDSLALAYVYPCVMCHDSDFSVGRVPVGPGHSPSPDPFVLVS